jgi:hypothetical protein
VRLTTSHCKIKVFRNITQGLGTRLIFGTTTAKKNGMDLKEICINTRNWVYSAQDRD